MVKIRQSYRQLKGGNFFETQCIWGAQLHIGVTGQLADAIGDFAYLVFLFGGICETASCPVRELAIRELAHPRVVQLGLPTLVPPDKYD